MSSNPDAAFRLSADDVVKSLGADVQHGLTDEEARARLARDGPNELAAAPPVPGWRKFLAQFQDILVILLLIATAVSAAVWFYERDSALPYEAIAIFAVVLLNAAIGFIQEERAEAAVAALRALSAEEASVIRGGERKRVPANEVVVGDTLLVEEGDTTPADARVVESTALQTAEATLTGESLPVTKDADPIAGDVALGDRTNMCSAARRLHMDVALPS
jgi:Ca2+-transporting ATPase